MLTAEEAKKNTNKYNAKRERRLQKIERGIKRAMAKGKTEYCCSWLTWGPLAATDIEFYLESLGYGVYTDYPLMIVIWD